MKITTKLFVPTVVVCILVAVAIAGFLTRFQKTLMEEELKKQAESIAQLFMDIRHVMAVNQDRINMDSMGNFEFKALNPARVGNMVAELVNKRAHIKVKQTSLRVRNKKMDSPDEFEKRVLETFEETKRETPIYQKADIGGAPYFRYMTPLKIKKACLKCHGSPAGEIDISGYPKEGYKLGDIRGAISVAIPMQQQLAQMRNNNYFLAAISGISVVLIAGCLIFFGKTYIVKPIENLIDDTERISTGDFSKPVDIPSNDEIGQLAESFERMRVSLKKSMELLEEDEDE